MPSATCPECGMVTEFPNARKIFQTTNRKKGGENWESVTCGNCNNEWSAQVNDVF